MTPKRCRFLALTLVSALLALNAASAAPSEENWPFPEKWLPVDAEGWTVLEPGPEARLIYVSSSEGDDAKAQHYSPASPEIGDDPFLPEGSLKPYSTIEKALQQARPGHGDWVLLKRGDSWEGGHGLPNGRSAAEPFVFTAYGGAHERPVLRGHARLSLGHFKPGRGGEFIVISGIELYDSRKDPDSPDYAVIKGEDMSAGGIFLGVGKGGQFRNVLVEDCLLRYAMVNFINYAKEGRDPDTPVTDVVIRRSLVLDMYRPIGHTVGIWSNDASFLLEECILDHNGWLHYRTPENRASNEPGIAIGLSHNTYLCNCYNTVFRGNMFLRGASQGNKWSSLKERGVKDIVLDNNLYMAGEFVLSAGGNGVGGHRFVNMAIINNLATHFGKKKGTGLGDGMGITDWDGGIIAGNLFRGPRFPGIRQNWAIHLGSRQWHGGRGGGTAPREPDAPPATPGKGLRDVHIVGNTFYHMDGGSPVVDIISGLDISEFLDNVTFADNRLHMPGINKTLLSISTEEIGKFTFSGNAYQAAGTDWFAVSGKATGFDEWVELTGEKGATDEPVDFPDPEHGILTYMKRLGYEPTLEAFYRECRRQSRRNWRPEFTAPVVNDWIREGFGMERVELKESADGRYRTPFQLVSKE